MKKQTKAKILSLTLALVLVCAVVFTACNNAGKEYLENYELEIRDTKENKVIDISAPLTQDFVLPQEIGDEDAGGPFAVTWSSSNKAITIKDYVGQIHMQEDDITNVKLTAKLVKGGATKSFTLRVQQFTTAVLADNYVFTRNNSTVYTGSSFKLERETSFQGRTATIDWSVSSANAQYLEISEDGNSCIVKSDTTGGAAQIQATFTWNQSPVTRRYNLTVMERAAYKLEPITEPAEGSEYKLGMFQRQKNAWYYANGGLSSNTFYFTTTTVYTSAVDFELKQYGSGWSLKCLGGANADKYLDLQERSGSTADDPKGSIYYVADPVEWQWSDTLHAFYREVLGAKLFLGNYGSYTDLGSSAEKYFTNSNPDDNNYLAVFGKLVKDDTIYVEPEEGPEIDTAGMTLVATFDMGDDGAAEHADGSTYNNGTLTSGSYTLTFSRCGGVYSGARDATGKGCFKLGTGTATGAFTLKVDENVDYVTFYVAGYKGYTTQILINNAWYYDVKTTSNAGVYTAITVDVRETHSVTFATNDNSNPRCMIDKIELRTAA